MISPGQQRSDGVSLVRPALVANARVSGSQPASLENAVIQNEANGIVPVIDIAPYLGGTPEGKRRVAAQVDRACRDVGFYVIVGHGVDPSLVDEVETAAREFFDLPLSEKMKVHIGKVPGGVGYSAVGDVALAHTRGRATPPDLNETFQIAKSTSRTMCIFKTKPRGA